MELLKTEKLNELFSYYYKLLTDKQVEYFKLYYYEDFSLAEIAKIHNVSRNAVHDQLKKVEQKLIELEEKLLLVENSNKTRELIDLFFETKDEKYLMKIIEMDVEDE